MPIGTPVLETTGSGVATEFSCTPFDPPANATLIAVACGRRSLGNLPGVPVTPTGGGELVWTEIASLVRPDTGTTVRLRAWWAETDATPPTNITLSTTISGSGHSAMAVISVTGAETDFTNQAEGNGSAGDATFTLPNAPDVGSAVLSFHATVATAGLTQPTGHTEILDFMGNSGIKLGCAHDTSSPAQSGTWTSNNLECICLGFELKLPIGPSASGGGVMVVPVTLGGQGHQPSTPITRDGFGIMVMPIQLGGAGGILGADNSDRAWQAIIRLGGRGGRTFIPVVPVVGIRGAADRTFYEVAITMTPSSKWVITPDVRAVSIDRRLNTWPGALEAGTADFTLDDGARVYSPLVNSRIRPNAEITVIATYIDEQTSVVSSYHLFSGFVDQIEVAPGHQERTVTLACRDRWKMLQDRLVSTSMMLDVPVATVIAQALASASIEASQRSVDLITDRLPFAFFKRAPLSDMMNQMVEGAGYGAWVSPNGIIRVRDRYFDIGGIAIAGGTYDKAAGLTVSVDEAQLVNRVTIGGTPWVHVQSLQSVANYDGDVFNIPAFSGNSFYLTFRDQRNQEAATAINLLTLVPASDYIFNSNSAGTGLNLNAVVSITVANLSDRVRFSIINTTTIAAYLHRLQVRGEPVVQGQELSVLLEASSSEVVYGVKEQELSTELFATQALLQRRAEDILEQFAAPNPTVQLTQVDDLPAALMVDLSNIVTVTNSHSGLQLEQFTVYGISHELRADDIGIVHQTTLELRLARSRTAFILNTHQLDVDRIGR